MVANYLNVADTTQVSTGPAVIVGYAIIGGSDSTKYELRDGLLDTSPLVLAETVAANLAAVRSVTPVGVSALRIVKVSGTASSFTVFYG